MTSDRNHVVQHVSAICTDGTYGPGRIKQNGWAAIREFSCATTQSRRVAVQLRGACGVRLPRPGFLNAADAVLSTLCRLLDTCAGVWWASRRSPKRLLLKRPRCCATTCCVELDFSSRSASPSRFFGPRPPFPLCCRRRRDIAAAAPRSVLDRPVTPTVAVVARYATSCHNTTAPHGTPPPVAGLPTAAPHQPAHLR